jgi:hypothetical protein
MQNLTPIPILPGLNDVPEILEDGPNGALVTQKVNQLVNKSFRPFNTLDDNTNAIERYVDTVNGLDTNTGLTPESPVKTIDKALEIFKTGMVSWNWNTFIYVKGELVAPIDLRGVYAASNDWLNEGTLTLDKWPSESVPFIIKDAPNPDSYLSLQVFIVDGNFVTINLQHCTLLIESGMAFVDNTIYFNNTTISPVSNSFYTSLMIGRGTYYLQGLTIDYTLVPTFLMTIAGIGACATLDGIWTFVGQPSNFFLRVAGGADVVSDFTFNNTDLSILVERGAKLRARPNQLLVVSVDEKSDFEWIYSEKDNDSLVLFFPELIDGRYKIWFPNKKLRLLEYRLSANAGNGTFQMDIGIGFPWGNPLTQTFTSEYEEIVRTLNIDFPPNSWRMFLNVTACTVPLKNVHLQLNYRNY